MQSNAEKRLQHCKKNGKIKWVLPQYETYVDVFLVLFNGYKCQPKVFFPTTSKPSCVKPGLLYKIISRGLFCLTCTRS